MYLLLDAIAGHPFRQVHQSFNALLDDVHHWPHFLSECLGSIYDLRRDGISHLAHLAGYSHESRCQRMSLFYDAVARDPLAQMHQSLDALLNDVNDRA